MAGVPAQWWQRGRNSRAKGTEVVGEVLRGGGCYVAGGFSEVGDLAFNDVGDGKNAAIASLYCLFVCSMTLRRRFLSAGEPYSFVWCRVRCYFVISS